MIEPVGVQTGTSVSIEWRADVTRASRDVEVGTSPTSITRGMMSEIGAKADVRIAVIRRI
jgi:hypothetical protein